MLYIHHGQGIGGAPLSLLFLIRKLDRSKYYPIVLCLYESPAADLYRNEGVETHIAQGIHEFSHTNLTWHSQVWYRRPWDLVKQVLAFWPSIWRSYRFVKTSKPDLVHLNSSALAPSAIGAKLAGVPVIWHVREPIHHGYFGIRRWLLKQCIHRVSDRVIAISEHDARQLVQSDKVRIVYNFVDFKEFDRGISSDGFRKELALDEGIRVVGMLGGVSMTKGTLEFVKAAKTVRGALDNVKFFIVGNYPRAIERAGMRQRAKEAVKRSMGITGYYQQIRAFIEREGLRQDIVFTGVRHGIPSILAGVDLVVFPSTVPHSARPIIEAGAMAKPVVTSDLEGPRELVAPGETGLLVPPKNPEALANAIITILSDEDLVRRMGEAGYRRARHLFDAEVNAQKTFEVYEELFVEPATQTGENDTTGTWSTPGVSSIGRKALYYYRTAQELPLHILIRKGARKLEREIRAGARKVMATLFSTRISDRQLLGALDERFESINAFLSHKTTRQQPHFFIDAQGKNELVEFISRRYPATIGQTVEQADKICDHTFDLLGSGEVRLGAKIDWHADFKMGWRWEPNKYYRDIQFMDLDEPYDVKVPWELSRCQHFVTLGKAYWYTGDEKYACEFIAQVSDWIEANPPQFGVNWRCTMDVAIRAVNWIWGYYFFKDSPSLTDDFRLKLFKSLLAHGRHIINNPSTGSGHSLEWSEVAGNHYLSDLAGLIYLGMMFPEFKEAERWLEIGLAELLSETRKQVYCDGVDCEASISYHRLVTELCLSAILLCRLNDIPIPEDVMDRLEAMMEFVMYYTKPDGTIPIIGDADNGRLHRLGTWFDAQREFFDHRYLLGIGAGFFDREDFAQAAGECWEEATWLLRRGLRRGSSGGSLEVSSSSWHHLSHNATRPGLASRSFPHGGLFIMRHNDLYLIISAMPNGKGGHGSHTHNDKLSFELYAHDKSFIIDPGTYVYTADYRLRNRYRSTAYHNTVVVDGEEQNRFDERNLFWIEHDAIPRINRWEVEEEYDLFDGQHSGYERLIEPVTHRRRICFDKLGGFWIIRDFLTGTGKHGFELYFHFAPMEVAFDEEMPLAVRTRCSRGTDLAVIPLRTEGVSVDIKRGWVSYSYGTRVEAPIVRYTKAAEVPTEFITVLFPVRQPTSVEEIRKIVTPVLNSISG